LRNHRMDCGGEGRFVLSAALRSLRLFPEKKHIIAYFLQNAKFRNVEVKKYFCAKIQWLNSKKSTCPCLKK
jgi:hypothetical protein